MAQHKVPIERWKHMIADLKSMPKREFTMYSVALRELMELANISSSEIIQKRAI
jgi:glutamate dehydrogenase